VELNFRKAQFSEAYVRVLAAVAGCSVSRPEPDIESEDLVLSARLTEMPIRSPKLAMQIKCSGVPDPQSPEIAFPLSIKNYDDLRPENLAIPRILAIIVVPGGVDPEAWLDHSEDRLCLLGSAFWASLFGYRASKNEVTVTVHIPSSQRLTAQSLKAMMVKIASDGKL